MSTSFNRDAFLRSLEWRYAVKKFDATRKVSAEDWQVLGESLRLSPSSYGLQPWKFLIVQTPELRKKLRPVSWNQSQVEDCSHYVVFTTLREITEDYINRFIALTAKVRGADPAGMEGYRKMMVGNLVGPQHAPTTLAWTQRQAYIAMGNLMNAAALMAIDTCPIEGLDPKKYDEILGLDNTPFSTVAAVAVGYRHAEDKYQHAKKIRFCADEVLEIR